MNLSKIPGNQNNSILSKFITNFTIVSRAASLTPSAVTSSFGAPVQTSIMGPHFLVQNVQLGYFLQYRNYCVSLGFFDDSVL